MVKAGANAWSEGAEERFEPRMVTKEVEYGGILFERSLCRGRGARDAVAEEDGRARNVSGVILFSRVLLQSKDEEMKCKESCLGQEMWMALIHRYIRSGSCDETRRSSLAPLDC